MMSLFGARPQTAVASHLRPSQSFHPLQVKTAPTTLSKERRMTMKSVLRVLSSIFKIEFMIDSCRVGRDDFDNVPQSEIGRLEI